MTDTPRMEWVRAHAAELTEIAARHGAKHVCLCGSVARGTDSEDSDLDFYVREFADDTSAGAGQSVDARRRANDLVAAFRAISPYPVDIRGIPGWLLGEEHEASMQRDAIDLSDLIR